MKSWRLIISPPFDGTANMAIDEALFSLNIQPTLRFYSWSRPTLSLGYFQKADENLFIRCKKYGIDVVRRPTGGRAVLHNSEITYAVTAGYKDFPGSSTLGAVYKTLAEWQIAAFADIGLKATLSGGARSFPQDYTSKVSCFLTSIRCDVVVAGKKICGSAQRRGLHSFLQQGTIPLELDKEQFLNISGENEAALQTFTTLKKERYGGSKEEFITIMSRRFEEILGCRLKNSALSDIEWEKTLNIKKGTSIHSRRADK